MTQYWIVRDGARRGPYKESEILEGIERSSVRASDLLWVDGMAQAVPIKDVMANFGSSPSSEPEPTLEPLTPAVSSPYRPPAARVDDFPQGAFDTVEYAGFWVRFAASLLDALVMVGFAVLLGLMIGLLSASLGFSVRKGNVWPNVIALGLSWLYFATLESSERCATFGKRAFHLQVLRDDDLERIGFLRASVRWIGRWISTLMFSIGYLMQPFTPRKRALHDYIAGTVVVVQEPYSRALVVAMVALGTIVPIIVAVMIGIGMKTFVGR